MIDIRAALEQHQTTMASLHPLIPQVAQIAERMAACIQSGGKIFWMGNGGSAADSQHLAAELVGRYQRERRGLPSIALTTDTSVLTAVANDYSFDSIFSRQIQALAASVDVVVGMSTSGESQNVLEGVRAAREIGAYTIGFSGGTGGELGRAADTCLIVPSSVTARIQEAHIVIGHIICDWIDSELAESTSS